MRNRKVKPNLAIGVKMKNANLWKLPGRLTFGSGLSVCCKCCAKLLNVLSFISISFVYGMRVRHQQQNIAEKSNVRHTNFFLSRL